MTRLPAQVAHAQAHAAAFAALLQGIDARDIRSRAALATLPVTRKHELLARQKAERAGDVFGGYSTLGWGPAVRGAAPRAARVRVARADLRARRRRPPTTGAWGARSIAAGFRAGDLAHNCFSYHFTPAGSMMETGAHAIGCTVFPGGTGMTEQQVQAIAELRPDGYIGTPELPQADLSTRPPRWARPLPSLRKASVGGEAFPPSLRDWFAARGIDAYQSYGTADLGLVAYETPAREGLVLDEDVIVEIVRPGTGDPVPEGEVGEVVVTTLNPELPVDPLRHRRPVGRAAGRLPDGAHQHPHPRLAGPRRPDHQGPGHVRAPGAGRRDRAPPRRGRCGRGWSSAARWPTIA